MHVCLYECTYELGQVKGRQADTGGGGRWTRCHVFYLFGRRRKSCLIIIDSFSCLIVFNRHISLQQVSE